MKNKYLKIFILSLLLVFLLTDQLLAVDLVNKRIADEIDSVNFNSGNSIGSGGGGSNDNLCLEPPPVNNLTYSRDNTKASITFKTPNVLNLSHFVARIATSVYQGNFDNWGDLILNLPTPIMDATQTIEINYLNPQQRYYFGIQVFNYCGKKSLIAIITLDPIENPPVCQPPLPINYLNILRNRENAIVSFKTPNLNNLSHFVIRYSSSTFQGDFQNWGQIVDHNLIPYPNATQTFSINNLNPGIKYYVGIKLFNNCNLGSEIAIKEISSFYTSGGGCPPVYPVEKISAQAGVNKITLNWQTPRGFNSNERVYFEIRKSLSPITSNNFYQAEIVPNNLQPIAGADQSFTISNLNSNTLYYFAIVLRNECDQISPIVTISKRTLENQVITGGGGGGSFGNLGGGGGVNISNNVSNYYIFINNNEPVTNDLNVILTLYAENASEMMISNYSDFRDGYWISYKNILNWRLLQGEGIKRVYAKFRARNGNVSEVIYDEILYQEQKNETVLQSEENQIISPILPSRNIPILTRKKINTDFNQLMVNWLSSERIALEKNDLNNDKKIDYEDVKILFNNWQDINILKTDYKITNFSLEPKYNLYLKAGEEIKILVLVKPIKNELNYSAQVVLNYLPDILEFKSFEYGKDWIPVLGISGYDYLDKEKGLLIKTAGYPKGFEEEKIFGIITFKARKEGQTLININNAFSLNNKNENVFKGLENSILVNNLKNENNNNLLMALVLRAADKNIFLAYIFILSLFLLIYVFILLLRKYLPLFLIDEEEKKEQKTKTQLEFNLN